jgi:hypothetical protein
MSEAKWGKRQAFTRFLCQRDHLEHSDRKGYIEDAFAFDNILQNPFYRMLKNASLGAKFLFVGTD